MSTTKTARYYVSSEGRTTCVKHGGGYFTFAITQDPDLEEFETPLDHWYLMTDDEITETREFYPSICETCHFHK